jgi:exopolyphosphatase/guanosine-5'-triphosphate,3'-diphosphate pyrophosphatase
VRFAIIDLGTNSVRFDVHELLPKRRIHRLHREKLMVRLGQDVFITGKLNPQAVKRTIQAFQTFHISCQRLRVERVIAFATCTLREAQDSEKFLQQLMNETGISVRVIPGADEAKLIAVGILAHERVGKGKVGLVDIGGGSTEICIAEDGELPHFESFPLGTARLQQVFLKQSPPKNGAVKDLREYIRRTLLPKLGLEKWPKVNRIIASSGTARTLAMVIRKTFDAKKADRGHLKSLIKDMSDMSASEICEIPGMEAKRADMILAGAVLLDECMDALRADEFEPTMYSLRDGILEVEAEKLRKLDTEPQAYTEKDFTNLARLFGAKSDAPRWFIEVAHRVFDELQPLHRLSPAWKIYLVAASILREVGESIAYESNHIHSYYIVKHADFPWRFDWEPEFVAWLCRYHAEGKISPKALPFAQDETKTKAFLRLVALLRVIDGFAVPETSADLKSIQMERRRVTMKFSGRGLCAVIPMRVERQKDLFEKIFNATITVEQV